MENEKKSLELTLQEAQALIQLMDIAVRVKGLEVAEAAIYLTKKVGSLFPPKQEEKKEETKEEKPKK